MNLFYFNIVFCLCGIFAQELIPCTTPNGETAFCVTLLECRVLLQAEASNDSVVSQFFNQSLCDNKSSTVCCGSFGNYTNTQTKKPLTESEMFNGLLKAKKKQHVLENLLPSKKYCGLQHTDDYFFNGTETSVDEFPWVVYIISGILHDALLYHLRIEDNYVGALISDQYVISTTDCRLPRRTEIDNGVYMKLAVHHIYKEVNCVSTPFGVNDCTDPALRVYSTQWKIYEDVVLFRLTKKVIFTDFIRPICLPLQNDQVPTAGRLVTASGWSEEEFVKGKIVKLKKRMRYRVMNNTDCEDSNTLKNPICGIPLQNNIHYFCAGDIGGPLMYKHRNANWFAVGLLRHPYSGCNEDQPVSATRLSPKIVNWIVENIEP